MKINRKIIYWFSFLLVDLLLAVSIVWSPVYFSAAAAGLMLLAVLAWKTEESLIAFIFYLPFQVALNITGDIDLASSRVLVAIFFLLWVGKSLAAKKVEIPFGAITALLLAFTGLAALSAFFSIDPGRSFVRLLYFLSIVPFYFVTAHYFNSSSLIKKVFGAVAISGAIAAILGIAQFLGQFIFGIDPVMDFMAKNISAVFYGQSFSSAVLANPSWLVNIGGETLLRAISLFPDPHIFAFYLGLVIPPAMTLFLRAKDFKFSGGIKTSILIINIILLLALGFTFSRAGYIGAVFGIAAVFVLNWKFLGKKAKFAVTAASLAVLLGLFFSPNPVVNRFFAVFNPSEGSNSARLANWTQALKIIENYPLNGVGVGAYALAIDPRSSPRSPITAHNTYLDIASEMGIFALAAWVTMLFLAMKKLLAISQEDNQEFAARKESSAMAAGLAGAFAWFSVQSVFDTAIYSPTLFALLMAYLAVTVNLGKEIS